MLYSTSLKRIRVQKYASKGQHSTKELLVDICTIMQRNAPLIPHPSATVTMPNSCSDGRRLRQQSVQRRHSSFPVRYKACSSHHAHRTTLIFLAFATMPSSYILSSSSSLSKTDPLPSLLS
mmetsp:Transcript_14481/g.34911  ORF Transcript_14481/g.34911 Transcript_14481/m.34911 type:complete len:121 (-) Transcript_14481:996-1358(-)